MEIKIRRLQINLITLGTGFIAFGMWEFIRTTLTSVLIPDESLQSMDAAGKWTVYIITWILAGAIFLIDLWIGLSARAEGNGKRKRSFYLVVIGFIILFNSILILAEIAVLIILHEHIFTYLITLVIDTTKLIITIDLLRSAITLRKLKKQCSAESPAALSDSPEGTETNSEKEGKTDES